jgi:hypothetical protein
MPDAAVLSVVRHRRAPLFTPTAAMRQKVELLAAFGVSQAMICAELVRDGVPCRCDNTLRKKFKAELERGRERMVAALGNKVLQIALSDRPNNLQAAMFLLGKLGGAMWREPKADETSLPPVSDGREEVVHFYLPANRRDQPDEEEPPTIIIDREPDRDPDC